MDLCNCRQSIDKQQCREKKQLTLKLPIIAHNRRLLMVMNTNIFCSDLMHRKAIKPRCGIMGVPILTLSNFLSSVRDKGTAPFGASPEAFGSPPEEQDMHTCLYFGWQLQRRQHLQAAFVCIYFLILCCRSV